MLEDEKKQVVFLDYDGVVNTYRWEHEVLIGCRGRWKCRCGLPSDGRVNNTQAVLWVSEFCRQCHYSIVVSSTWRLDDHYADYLRNAWLDPEVKIIGRTPRLEGKTRGDEISQYLKEHPEVSRYLIFDDDVDMGPHMDRLVKCDSTIGFGLREFKYAVMLANEESIKRRENHEDSY